MGGSAVAEGTQKGRCRNPWELQRGVLRGREQVGRSWGIWGSRTPSAPLERMGLRLDWELIVVLRKESRGKVRAVQHQPLL